MEEVLLGRPLLRTLGFDLERFLSANRNRLDNTDVSGLPSAEDKQGGRFCSLQSYNGLWYNKTEDSPIQLPTTISAEVENEEEQVRAAFKDTLKEASKNYITVEGGVKLSELLDEYTQVRYTTILKQSGLALPLLSQNQEGSGFVLLWI